ncbi:spexin [Pseudonaja textilis]|uniref:spexin n=1 Tax=Pseudonaja textilis TaxID=8673 RepID=UPI000EA9AFD1|nr:spexin [Pseudonaja textilis]
MKKLHSWANGPLALYLLASFITFSWGVPQGHFQRRNWTPQAMLYLKGSQGRRFISEESQQKALYDRLMQERSSQNVNPLTLSEDALAFLSLLQKIQNEEEEEKAPEKPRYFADGLLNY